MIKTRYVIRLKVPFPSMESRLAKLSHMYICVKSKHPDYEFVKCQTLKPYMLINNPLMKYVDETPDVSRNPFSHATRIDCDKKFCTHGVEYDEKLAATTRKDVCEELFELVNKELLKTEVSLIKLNEDELVFLNALVRFIVKT